MGPFATTDRDTDDDLPEQSGSLVHEILMPRVKAERPWHAATLSLMFQPPFLSEQPRGIQALAAKRW